MCSSEIQQNNYCWFAIIVWEKRCFFLSPKTRLQQKDANESNEPNLVISGCAANARVNNAAVFLSIVGAEKNRNTENRGVEIIISCKWSFAVRSSGASLHRFITAEHHKHHR